MKTIVVPLDFSDVSIRVMETATAIARGLNARIFLLHVVPPPIVMTAYGMTEEQFPEILGQEQEEANRKLHAYRENLKAEGVDVSILTVQGPPTEAILLVAREHSADMLIMGSHGHGAFYEFVVGSTTRGVLKGFPGPVLLVPSRREPRARKSRPS